MKRIGILGGTFDPVHCGHIHLAEDAMKQGNLDEVVFIPAGLQPFKLLKKITSGEDRLTMLKLATEDMPGFTVSSYELDAEGVSYTYLTLRALQKKYGPNARLYFITGTDAFLAIELWMNAAELLQNYSFLIGTRPGYKEEELTECIARVREKFHTEVININNTKFDISSTEIREKIQRGESADGLLPEKVEAYIREKGLYLEKELDCEYWKSIIEPFLQEHLKPKRLKHTYGVAAEAKKLAKRYGEDSDKAELAGLCHDMMRNISPKEAEKLAKKYGLPEKLAKNPNLAHGRIAANVLRDVYGMHDEDLLNAVMYHTTGRKGMSRLEKILYLADAIEPGRDYPQVKALRKAAEEDLDKACILCMERSMEYVRSTGAIVDRDTIDACEDIKENKMESKEMAMKIAKLLDERKAIDVQVIDIALKSSFADYFVMASGGSERQMAALVDNIEDLLEPDGVFPKNVEGTRSSGWILMDYGDVVVNVMTVEMREKYNIEKIWGDCESLTIG